MRIKLDYNNLMERIDMVLSRSRSKIVREEAFGIAHGLSILSSYIEKIAIRAIELEDDFLIGLLLDLNVIKKEE